jgi:hypothetical protein
MRIERNSGGLLLEIKKGFSITLKQEWVGELSAIPYEQYGDFIKKSIYPTLSDDEKKNWHNSQISNLELHSAIHAVP